jgi:hypothetical protein
MLLAAVLLHSAFLTVEQGVVLYTLGPYVIANHPVRPVLGLDVSRLPDVRPAIAAAVVLAALAVLAVRAMHPHAWPHLVGEAVVLTSVVALTHTAFLFFIAMEVLPEAPQAGA